MNYQHHQVYFIEFLLFFNFLFFSSLFVLVKRHENECSNRQRSSNVIINNEKDKINQSIDMSKKKYLSRKQQNIEFNSSIDQQKTKNQMNNNITDQHQSK